MQIRRRGGWLKSWRSLRMKTEFGWKRGRNYRSISRGLIGQWTNVVSAAIGWSGPWTDVYLEGKYDLLRGRGGSSTSCAAVTCVPRPTTVVVTSSWEYARFSWPERLVAWLSNACNLVESRNDRLSISCLSSSSFRFRNCSYNQIVRLHFRPFESLRYRIQRSPATLNTADCITYVCSRWIFTWQRVSNYWLHCS